MESSTKMNISFRFVIVAVLVIGAALIPITSPTSTTARNLGVVDDAITAIGRLAKKTLEDCITNNTSAKAQGSAGTANTNTSTEVIKKECMAKVSAAMKACRLGSSRDCKAKIEAAASASTST